MRRFIYKVCFWIFIVFTFVLAVLLPLDNHMYADRKRLYLEGKKEVIDLMIFGSSRAEHTIIPDLIDTKLNIFNMGRDGHGLPSNYFYLKLLLKKKQKKIKAILLEVSEFTLNGSEGFSRKFRDDFFVNDINTDEELYEAYKTYRGKAFAATMKYFPKFSYLVYNDFRKFVRTYPLVLKRFSKTINQSYEQSIEASGRNKGYVPITKRNKVEKKNEVKRFILEEEDVNYFKKIVELCREYEIKLMLFRAPVLYCNEFNSDPFDAFIQKFSKENSIPFYDYKCSYQFPQHYYDNTHASDAIARLLSKDIKQHIRRDLYTLISMKP